MKIFLITFIVICLFLIAFSCSAFGAYIMKQSVGQMKMLANKKSIEKVLFDPLVDDKTKNTLKLVKQIKEFAKKNIGLRTDGIYESFIQLDRDYVAYALSVSPKLELKPYMWNFPIVGAMPYKGFFNVEDGKKEKREFDEKRYDTYLRGVPAYSTLGWFDDPILSPMINWSEADLAGTIIHELAHATIYKKGDTDFNENLAEFVETEGTKDYLKSKFGQHSKEYKSIDDENHDKALFSQFIDRFCKALEELYAKQISDEEKSTKKEQVISQYKEIFKNEVIPNMTTDNYKYFVDKKINNAVLMNYSRYMRDLTKYQNVFKHFKGDWPQTLNFFREIKEGKLDKSEMDKF